jgi:hypothetical protein
MELELRFEGEEPWATQKQIAELFGRDISVISRHLKAIFAEGELDEESNLQKVQIAGSDKPAAIYSLDAILAGPRRLGLDSRPLILAQFHGNVPDAKKKEKVTRELDIYRERVRLEKEAKGGIEAGKLLERARQIVTDKREKREPKDKHP